MITGTLDLPSGAHFYTFVPVGTFFGALWSEGFVSHLSACHFELFKLLAISYSGAGKFLVELITELLSKESEVPGTPLMHCTWCSLQKAVTSMSSGSIWYLVFWSSPLSHRRAMRWGRLGGWGPNLLLSHLLHVLNWKFLLLSWWLGSIWKACLFLMQGLPCGGQGLGWILRSLRNQWGHSLQGLECLQRLWLFCNRRDQSLLGPH